MYKGKSKTMLCVCFLKIFYCKRTHFRCHEANPLPQLQCVRKTGKKTTKLRLEFLRTKPRLEFAYEAPTWVCVRSPNLSLRTTPTWVCIRSPDLSLRTSPDLSSCVRSPDLSSCVRSPDLSLRTWSFGVLELWCVDALSFVEIFSRQFFQVHFKISLS